MSQFRIEPTEEPMRVLGYLVQREEIDYPDRATIMDERTGRQYLRLGKWRGTGKWYAISKVIPLTKAKALLTAASGPGVPVRIIEVIEGATIHYTPPEKK